MITWARPRSPQFTRFCAVREIAAGSVSTWCSGHWPTETSVDKLASPPEQLRCGGCVSQLALSSCSVCGTHLLPSARARGDGLCGLHSRAACGAATAADLERGLVELREAVAVEPRPGVLFEAFDLSDGGEA